MAIAFTCPACREEPKASLAGKAAARPRFSYSPIARVPSPISWICPSHFGRLCLQKRMSVAATIGGFVFCVTREFDERTIKKAMIVLTCACLMLLGNQGTLGQDKGSPFSNWI